MANMTTQEILQGIKDWAAPKVIYDISAAHNNTKYTDLADALGTNGGNIPQEYRKGGITVRYVQSNDNKYVQFRLMADAFTTDVTQWQGVDDEPTPGSENLVTSYGVAKYIADRVFSNENVVSSLQSTLELGNISGMGTNTWAYQSSTTRLRTKQGTYLNLFKGDTIRLSDYTNAKMYIGCDGDYTKSSQGWLAADYIIPADGKYVVLLTNVVEEEVTVEGLGSRLQLKSNSLSDAAYKDIDDEPTAGSNNLVKSDGINSLIIQNSQKEKYASTSKPLNARRSDVFSPLALNSECLVKIKVDSNGGTVTRLAVADNNGNDIQIASNFVFAANKEYYFKFKASIEGLVKFDLLGSKDVFAADINVYYLYDSMSDNTSLFTNIENEIQELDNEIQELDNKVFTKDYIGEFGHDSDSSSTYIQLPYEVYKNNIYNISLTFDKNITADVSNPITIWSTKTAGSSTQIVFAEITENVTANIPVNISGTFPDNERKYIRCLSFPNTKVDAIISTKVIDIEMMNLSDEIKAAMGLTSDIVSLNPQSKNILNNACIKKARNTNLNVFTIAHISDTHGNDQNMQRFNEYCEYFANFIDQRVNTGDVVQVAYNISEFDSDLFEKTIISLGNHDTASYEGGVFDNYAHQGIDAFNRYIAPLYQGWNVTLAEDAAQNGYCYFYKDYTSKKIRFIILDAMANQSNDEVSWLQDRLAETLDSNNETYGYSVIIAMHYIPVTDIILFDSAFTSLYTPQTSNQTLLTNSVASFIANGGKFIAWLTGHVHRDYIGKLESVIDGNTIKQLVLCVSTGSDVASNQDRARVVGEKSQDLFNIYGIDTTNKLIKIFRVGADYDMWCRESLATCINYETAELIV